MRGDLIVANQTLGGQELMHAIHERIAAGPCRFHVLVPATDRKDFYTAVVDAYSGDIDDQHAALGHAQKRLDQQLAMLRDVGAHADGEVGNPDPVKAIGTVLPKEHFDEIILSTLPTGISRWLHMDLHHRVAHHFEIPVTHVETLHFGAIYHGIEGVGVTDKTAAGESAEADEKPPPAAQISADLDELERHIEQVRHEVAQFHHQGERHFIDQGSRGTDPAVEASLERLKSLDTRWHASRR